VESDDPDVEIEREVLRTSVVALDLRSGRFEVISTERSAARARCRSGFATSPSISLTASSKPGDCSDRRPHHEQAKG
jgi:hypothetical protein